MKINAVIFFSNSLEIIFFILSADNLVLTNRKQNHRVVLKLKMSGFKGKQLIYEIKY